VTLTARDNGGHGNAVAFGEALNAYADLDDHARHLVPGDPGRPNQPVAVTIHLDVRAADGTAAHLDQQPAFGRAGSGDIRHLKPSYVL